MAASFLDTNVLIYSISTNPDERGKQARAREILAASDLVLSVQVLQEFYFQVTRPSRPHRLSHKEAMIPLRTWRRYPIVDVTHNVFKNALELCGQYHLSYWDSAIIAAASLVGCGEVLTEDMQDGAVIAGVRLRNPFL